MSKIKFNKEWYLNNDIAIYCESLEEATELYKQFKKVNISKNWDILRVYYIYKDKTCYNSTPNGRVEYSPRSYYETHNYTIIKFSDLEFEDEMKILANNFKTLGEDYSSASLTTDTKHKRTILRGDVELSEGDVVCVHYDYNDIDMIGIILNNNILYNDGDFDKIDSLQDIIDENLVWYIKAEDCISLGGYISELLFKDELDDELKDLIVHVQDKPKEPIKRAVEIFKVKFHKSDTITTPFISDDESIFMKNVVSPISGIYADRYGTVENIIYDKLTQEQINTYDKIIKIK